MSTQRNYAQSAALMSTNRARAYGIVQDLKAQKAPGMELHCQEEVRTRYYSTCSSDVEGEPQCICLGEPEKMAARLCSPDSGLYEHVVKALYDDWMGTPGGVKASIYGRCRYRVAEKCVGCATTDFRLEPHQYGCLSDDKTALHMYFYEAIEFLGLSNFLAQRISMDEG